MNKATDKIRTTAKPNERLMDDNLFAISIRAIFQGVPDDQIVEAMKAYRKTVAERIVQVARHSKPNDPCPCKSGLKFKRCCKLIAANP